MLDATPQTIYLRDYTPPTFHIDTVALDFDIGDSECRVRSRLSCRRNPDADPASALSLHGEALTLCDIRLDGRTLSAADYETTDQGLVIPSPPERFELETEVSIHPDDNTQLMGLYRSKDGYFTQCEAEGFRRITYFLDRPDVMSRYTTTIHADRERFPVLLSNGNLIDGGEEAGDRHFARWEDPFPKPSYLFAMVAARLEKRATDFVTASGRTVSLQVFVEPGQLDQSAFALEALQEAMRWDERVFGLELDLDQYMIVAVSDFNMGAMENKGLNIFNTRYVLARPDTATDTDYMMLDRVVAHEYFHNWTGNRVTCRDWFQLSLKEGLTVFRDQQYGADRYSHAVQRIQEVRLLRASQYPEDAGPMAHPVRPDSYIEISNFYTATVYNKGAEVVRRIHTLIGEQAFRSGMDLYFERHDGQAVCTENFVAAMADASGVDLSQFERWYAQAGTPVVDVEDDYDGDASRYTLRFRQHTAATPGQEEKLPFHIPVAVALVGGDGQDLSLRNAGEEAAQKTTTAVLSLTEAEQAFHFDGVNEPPTPSLLRGFSAPVILNFSYSDDALGHLAAHDSDPFNRWEAGQRLAVRVLINAVSALQNGQSPDYGTVLTDACRRVLADAAADPAFAAEALSLPGATYLAEQMDVVDPDAILAARNGLRRHLAAALKPAFLEAYRQYVVPGPYSPAPDAAGRRALRNLALGYLMELDEPATNAACFEQLKTADNMTDAMAALVALANSNCAEREDGLQWFYARWRDEPLVVDKWFAVQAGSRLPTALEDVRLLMAHPAFELRNPNKVRALIGAFCHGNHAGFHASDGQGYTFGADQVIALDALNAQVAARLARAFDRWKKFDAGRQALATAALQRIKETPGLSKDTFEIVSRALA